MDGPVPGGAGATGREEHRGEMDRLPSGGVLPWEEPIYWTRAMRDKIRRKHGVLVAETRQAQGNACEPPRSAENGGKGSRIYYGQTEAGRYLFLVAYPRDGRNWGASARDMTTAERRHYHGQKNG